MTWQIFISIASTFGLCAASVAFPLINGELVLVAAILAAPVKGVGMSVALVFAAAFGQMLAKIPMYFGGRGVLKVAKEGKLRNWIERYRGRMEKNASAPTTLLFVSAAVGLPPFYVISILAGTFRIPFWRFFVVGSVGRLIHFGVVALFPELGEGIINYFA